jgi:DNA polymerase-3 subunit delta'
LFESVVGQEQAKKTLRATIESGRIPHTLLFAGPNGVGKGETALELARMLLCTEGVASECDSCGSCHRAAKIEHPDLHVLFPFRAPPDGSSEYQKWMETLQEHRELIAREKYPPVVYEKSRSIVIDIVNDVYVRLMESSFEGGRRVCVIFHADKLNVKTANTLLKILEEPPDGVHFILTTENLSSVLPTITSRSSIIRFRRLTAREVDEYLAGMGVGDSRQRQAAAAVSDGSLKTAKAVALSDSSERYARSIDMFVKAAMGTYGDVISASSSFQWSRDYLEAEEIVHGFVRLTRRILEAKLGMNAGDNNMNAPVEQLAEKTSVSALNRLSAGLEKALDMLGRNVNIALVMSTIQYEIHDAF